VPPPVEPRGVLAWVPDGTVLDLGGARVGSAGGATGDQERGPDPVHVFITHHGPTGMSLTDRMAGGTPLGEPSIARFLKGVDGPALNVFGHRHHTVGPRPHRRPEGGGEAASRPMLMMLPLAQHPPGDGSLGVLDCAAGTFWVAGREDNVVSAVEPERQG
jgi:hypothetical protein